MTDKKTTYFSRRRANSWQKKKVAIGKATDFATRVRECDYCGRLNIPVGTNGKLAKHTTSTNANSRTCEGSGKDPRPLPARGTDLCSRALVAEARDRLHRALDAVLDRKAAKDVSAPKPKFSAGQSVSLALYNAGANAKGFYKGDTGKVEEVAKQGKGGGAEWRYKVRGLWFYEDDLAAASPRGKLTQAQKIEMETLHGLLWPTSGKTSLDKTQWDNAHKKWNALALVEHLPARDRLHRALDAVLDRRAAKDASGTWQTTPKKAAYYGITNPTPGIDFNTYDYSINGEWLGSAGYGGGSAPYTAQVMYVLGTRPDGQPRRSSKSKSFSSIAAAKAFVESNAAPTGSPHRAKDTAARDAVDLKRQAALTQLRKLQENDFQNASNKEEEARAKYKAAGSAQRAALSAKWDAASAKVEEISRKMDAIAKSFPGLYDEL